MLGKLIKYEFRATARLFLPIYAAILILSGLVCLVNALSDSGAELSFLTVILVLLYVLAAVGLAVTTVVVIVSRFYKNLLGSEGYLMFTLPVTTGQNILAKLIPAVCWTVGSCVLCFVVLIMQSAFQGGLDIRFSGGEGLGMLLFCLLSLTAFILFCYMCMAIGQTFNEHKFLASVGAFIVIQMILQVLGVTTVFSIARLSLFGGFIDRMFDTINHVSAWWPISILNLGALAVCAVLFLITRWLLNKKLNLA